MNVLNKCQKHYRKSRTNRFSVIVSHCFFVLVIYIGIQVLLVTVIFFQFLKLDREMVEILPSIYREQITR
jgi:hypothetical protein